MAKVDHYKVQREFGGLSFSDAGVELGILILQSFGHSGGQLGRNDIRSRLAGRIGSGKWPLFIERDQLFDTHLFMDHVRSVDLFHKGILDYARAVFCGRILVQQERKKQMRFNLTATCY